MPEQFYKDALKLGQKERRHCVSQGRYPYLPVLEEIVSKEQLLTGVRLGLMQIPAEFIVGTKTVARTNTFARNFMPLAEERTEFADKWETLCKSHLREGIRDPIKVYEYVNRFYVEEGNKRVSVLKFFDAVSIPAEVIRIYPPKNGSKEVKCYEEFLDFYKCSKINYIEFSRPGSYCLLQKLLGKAPDEIWTEDDRSKFQAAYFYFKHLYGTLGGNKLKVSASDAMLSYIKIYGYDALRSKSSAEMKEAILKIWEEFELLKEDQSIDIKADPEEEKKQSLLQRMFKEDVKIRKVAFIYDKAPADSGWIYGHELGRQHVQKVFEGSLITTAYVNVLNYTPEQIIEQAIKDGNHIIFTTSPRLLNASLAAAVEHPDRLILNCSLNKPHRYIRTYYARMYEVKFIIGAIAGIMTDNNKIGYLCDYPIYGQVAGINAFAMGVQMVNPSAKVYLEWSSTHGTYVAIARLRKSGINIISGKDFASPESDERTSFGLFKFDENGKTNLAMPIWHWGVYYEKLIRSFMNHTMQWEYEESNRALNYYWGMSAGVVELICSNKLPEGIHKLAELLKDSICSGLCRPFRGPFRAQNGEVIDKDRQGLSFEQIITMEWLAENVEGSIPTYEQLNDEGKATVESAGAPSAKTGGLYK